RPTSPRGTPGKRSTGRPGRFNGRKATLDAFCSEFWRPLGRARPRVVRPNGRSRATLLPTRLSFLRTSRRCGTSRCPFRAADERRSEVMSIETRSEHLLALFRLVEGLRADPCEDVASSIPYSREHLNRILQSVIGESVKRLSLRLRLERSAYRLCSGEGSV